MRCVALRLRLSFWGALARQLGGQCRRHGLRLAPPHPHPLPRPRRSCIPKNTPGADWRVLEEIVKADPSREKFKGQPLVPWCLPNTADRHNGWRGLFGRLDWAGHFPTSTTDPQPMGKVGQGESPPACRSKSLRGLSPATGRPLPPASQPQPPNYILPPSLPHP